MDKVVALLICDLVDSTGLASRLGEARYLTLSRRHDQLARSLTAQWDGQEIDRSDGFLLMFCRPENALCWAEAYHTGLAQTDTNLKARVGIHWGPVKVVDVERKVGNALVSLPEVHGVAKAVSARLANAARAEQTLVSREFASSLAAFPASLKCWGYWKMAGLPEPKEIIEVVRDSTSSACPQDAPKCYRVVEGQRGWEPASSVPHTLPLMPHEFVGRNTELEQIAGYFEAGHPSVCLIGPGGIGKSALALHFAKNQLGAFPGGIWYCDASAACDQEGLLAAASLAVKLPALSSQSSFLYRLAQCKLTLILIDNADGVKDCASRLAELISQNAPDARVIVTQRELKGSQCLCPVKIGPLSPAEAKTLFEMKFARSGTLNPKLGREIEALLEVLDGLPLAVEISAARTRLLEGVELRRRTRALLHIKAAFGEARAMMARHSTLYATFEWSWRGLNPDEQSFLISMSCLEGNLSLAAAASLAPAMSIDQVDSVLEDLTCKSLLNVRPNGQMAFGTLFREFLREKVESTISPQEYDEILNRRDAYFLALSRKDILATNGDGARDLVSCARRMTQLGKFEQAVSLVEHAWLAVNICGPISLCRDVADNLASLVASGELRSRVLRLRAEMQAALGQFTEALQTCRDAFAHLGGKKTLNIERRLLFTQGSIQGNSGSPVQAEALLRRCLATTVVERAEPWYEIEVLNALAINLNRRGMDDEAFKMLHRAASLAREHGETRWQAGLIGNLGNICLRRGEWQEASRYLCEAVDLATSMGDTQWEGNTHCNLGLAYRMMGKYQLARTELERAIFLAERNAFTMLYCTAVCNLGATHLENNELILAKSCLERALEATSLAHVVALEGFAAANMGLLRAKLHMPRAADEMFSIAKRAAETVSDPDAAVYWQVQKIRADLCIGAPLVAKSEFEELGRKIRLHGSLISAETLWTFERLAQRFNTHDRI